MAPESLTYVHSWPVLPLPPSPLKTQTTLPSKPVSRLCSPRQISFICPGQVQPPWMSLAVRCTHFQVGFDVLFWKRDIFSNLGCGAPRAGEMVSSALPIFLSASVLEGFTCRQVTLAWLLTYWPLTEESRPHGLLEQPSQSVSPRKASSR